METAIENAAGEHISPVIEKQYHSDAQIVLFEGLAEDFVVTIPEQSINLIISSPPYNLGKEYETEISIDDYLGLQASTIANLVKVLRNDGSICWQVGNYVQNGEVFPLDVFYYGIFKKLGLYLRNRIIWRFGHGLHTSKRFSGRYETLLWFTKSDDYIFNLDPVRIKAKYPGKRYSKGTKKGEPSGNPKGKNPSDVWEILCEEWETGFWEIPNVKANHAEKTIHPCQFPVELVERCVLALTNEGDTVFDPYSGVGSALIAALKHNRKAIGCEKESRYTSITTDRIYKYNNNKLALRPLHKPIHKPNGKEAVSQVPEPWLTTKDSIYYREETS